MTLIPIDDKPRGVILSSQEIEIIKESLEHQTYNIVKFYGKTYEKLIKKLEDFLNSNNAQNGSSGSLPGVLPSSLEAWPSSAENSKRPKCKVCGIYKDIHNNLPHQFVEGA